MKRILVIVGLIVISFQFSIFNSASAQNNTRPKISCPNGIWINSYSGVLFYQRTDVSIPCRSMPLAAVFYYNSSANETNYGYGNGWSLGYEWRYKTAHNDSLITIIQGNGRGDEYWIRNGAYFAPAGVFSTLTYVGGTVTLTTRDGMVYTFADPESKKVTQVRDRNNNSINLTYTAGNLTQLTDPAGRTLVFEYDVDGNLTRLTDPAGRFWTYVIDADGNLTSVTNAAGHSVHYGYNKQNRISTFTDPAGHSTWVTYNEDGYAHRVRTELTDKSIRYEKKMMQTVIVDYMGEGQPSQFTTYKWDSLGRVIEKTGNCCGSVAKYEYDEDNNITRSEDANGNVTTYTYDDNGNMLTVTDALGNTDSYEYYTESYPYLPKKHIDKAGRVYQFFYDANGNMTQKTGPEGEIITSEYNDYGQEIIRTDAMGNEITSNYDNTYGYLFSKTDQIGNTTYYTHNNSTGTLQSVTDPFGNITSYTYDSENNLSTVTDPYGNVSQYTYSASGQMITATSPHSTLSFMQDANGHLTQIISPAGTVKYAHNAKGKVTSEENILGYVKQYGYDERNRLTTATDALGNTMSYSYDGVNNIIGESYSTGHTLEYTYNELNQLIEVKDQNGLISQVTYDPLGRKTQVKQAKIKEGDNYTYDTYNYTYDVHGNLTTLQTPYNTFSYEYNLLGLCTSVTDISNNSSNYTYDAAGRIISATDTRGNTFSFTYDDNGNGRGQLLSRTDGNGNTTNFSYDERGRLKTMTDANNKTTQYSYDNKGRVSRIIFPNGKTEEYAYNTQGNLIQFKDKAGNQFLYEHDASNRLVKTTYPDGSIKQYGYDAAGHLRSVNKGNSSINRDYDAIGRLLTETTVMGAETYTTSFAFDEINNRLTVTYPSGRVVNFNHNGRGLLEEIEMADNASVVAQIVADYNYNYQSILESIDYGNGIVTQYGRDAKNRLRAIIAGEDANSHVQYQHFGYDPLGNILAKVDSVNLSGSEFYQYDNFSRLTQFSVGIPANTLTQSSNSTVSQQYSYDALGNRTGAPYGGVNAVNGYTTVGGQTMLYDDNGNLVDDGVHTYQYDYNNRLVSVDNGAVATYSYDALGRRIKKVVAGITTDYRYAGKQMIESTTNNVTTSYVYSPRTDDVLMAVRGDDKYYFHKDHLGSTMAVTDANGNVVERYRYDAFGTPHFYNAVGEEMAASAIGNDILFTGREYDPETGLYYYRARTMNPAMGRFLQQDPIKYGDGLNMYAYVHNKPAHYMDPLGLDGCNGTCDPLPKHCMYHPEECDLSNYGEGAVRSGASFGGCMVAKLGLCLEIKIGKQRYNSNDPGKRTPWQSFIEITPMAAAGGDATGHLGAFFEYDWGKQASADAVDVSFYSELAGHGGQFGGAVSFSTDGENMSVGANGSVVVFGFSGGASYDAESGKWKGVAGTDVGIAKDGVGYGVHFAAGPQFSINPAYTDDALNANIETAIEYLEYMDGYWDDVLLPEWQHIDDSFLRWKRETSESINNTINDIKNLPDKAVESLSQTMNAWVNQMCNF